MDPQEYVAARYGRLLEYAVELGAPEGQAHEYVDHVLATQQRAIRRASDPDPVVREALARAVRHEPEPTRSPWPLVGLALAVIVGVVGYALTRPPATEPMPSLFALDGAGAEALLTAAGYDVTLRPVRECEPLGQVLGSDPPTGDPVEAGARVAVFTAVPSGSDCEARYLARTEAWQFLRFAVDGSTDPRFARSVSVIIDGDEGEPLRGGAGVGRSVDWQPLRELVAVYGQQPVGPPTGLPQVAVTRGVPPESTCGIDRPDFLGDRSALRVQVDTRPIGADFGCPLTIDLYRDAGEAIDAVVIHSPVTPP
jgi:hypothetical protein